MLKILLLQKNNGGIDHAKNESGICVHQQKARQRNDGKQHNNAKAS